MTDNEKAVKKSLPWGQSYINGALAEADHKRKMRVNCSGQPTALDVLSDCYRHLVALTAGTEDAKPSVCDIEPRCLICHPATPSAEKPCRTCMGSGRIGAPCPDGKPGCAVYHNQPCPSCAPAPQGERPNGGWDDCHSRHTQERAKRADLEGLIRRIHAIDCQCGRPISHAEELLNGKAP